MPDDFVIARNPDGDSALPYLLRIPLGDDGIVLKSRETWPRTTKVYCHRVEAWPEDAEVIERVPVRSCIRRGASIDLVLDRGRENRSQLVMTRIRGGRQAIFWQTARTAKQARPAVAVPRARASGLTGQAGLEIVVDSHERYAYSFADQQVVTRKAGLSAGDYGVVRDEVLIASVERKSLVDLVSSLTSGKLKYQLADLSSVPRAAVVVEERYSAIFKLDRVRPAVVLDGLAECQVRWPQVPIHFCETRKLAAEWTYRFLAAASVAAGEDDHGAEVVSTLSTPPPLAAAPATPAEIRSWAASNGYEVSDRGRVRREVVEAFERSRG